MLTIGVLALKESTVFEDLDFEFFCEPGEDSQMEYQHDTLSISYEYTNKYWDLVPDLEKLCDQDDNNIWQQIVWEFEGDFNIPIGTKSVFDYVRENIGCSLWVETEGADLVEYHFRILSVENS